MAHPIFLSIALWIWAASAIGAIAFMIWLWVDSANSDDGKDMAALLVLLQAAVGLLFSSLDLLGFPLIALWTWRILSGAVMIACLVVSARLTVVGKRATWRSTSPPEFRAHSRPAPASDYFLIFGTTALAIVVFVCAVAATTPQSGATVPPPTSTLGSVAHTIADSLVRIDFWHAGSLAVLGCGTLLFGLLFIAALQRQGLLWFESNSGSLGGGVGGWRMSSSMGYLGATILFAVMFGALIVHDENLFRASIHSGDASPPAANSQNPPLSAPAKGDSNAKGESSVHPPSGSAAKQP
jgi:hypothetical protein